MWVTLTRFLLFAHKQEILSMYHALLIRSSVFNTPSPCFWSPPGRGKLPDAYRKEICKYQGFSKVKPQKHLIQGLKRTHCRKVHWCLIAVRLWPTEWSCGCWNLRMIVHYATTSRPADTRTRIFYWGVVGATGRSLRQKLEKLYTSGPKKREEKTQK